MHIHSQVLHIYQNPSNVKHLNQLCLNESNIFVGSFCSDRHCADHPHCTQKHRQEAFVYLSLLMGILFINRQRDSRMEYIDYWNSGWGGWLYAALQ